MCALESPTTPPRRLSLLQLLESEPRWTVTECPGRMSATNAPTGEPYRLSLAMMQVLLRLVLLLRAAQPGSCPPGKSCCETIPSAEGGSELTANDDLREVCLASGKINLSRSARAPCGVSPKRLAEAKSPALLQCFQIPQAQRRSSAAHPLAQTATKKRDSH